MRVSGELRAMRRWLPITIVLAAAVAEAIGLGQIAFYLLLVAVPIVAATALTTFGELLDSRFEPAESLQALLYGVALLLLVAGCRGRIDGVRAVRVSGHVRAPGAARARRRAQAPRARAPT